MENFRTEVMLVMTFGLTFILEMVRFWLFYRLGLGAKSPGPWYYAYYAPFVAVCAGLGSWLSTVLMVVLQWLWMWVRSPEGDLSLYLSAFFLVLLAAAITALLYLALGKVEKGRSTLLRMAPLVLLDLVCFSYKPLRFLFGGTLLLLVSCAVGRVIRLQNWDDIVEWLRSGSAARDRIRVTFNVQSEAVLQRRGERFDIDDEPLLNLPDRLETNEVSRLIELLGLFVRDFWRDWRALRTEPLSLQELPSQGEVAKLIEQSMHQQDLAEFSQLQLPTGLVQKLREEAQGRDLERLRLPPDHVLEQWRQFLREPSQEARETLSPDTILLLRQAMDRQVLVGWLNRYFFPGWQESLQQLAALIQSAYSGLADSLQKDREELLQALEDFVWRLCRRVQEDLYRACGRALKEYDHAMPLSPRQIALFQKYFWGWLQWHVGTGSVEAYLRGMLLEQAGGSGSEELAQAARAAVLAIRGTLLTSKLDDWRGRLNEALAGYNLQLTPDQLEQVESRLFGSDVVLGICLDRALLTEKANKLLAPLLADRVVLDPGLIEDVVKAYLGRVEAVVLHRPDQILETKLQGAWDERGRRLDLEEARQIVDEIWGKCLSDYRQRLQKWDALAGDLWGRPLKRKGELEKDLEGHFLQLVESNLAKTELPLFENFPWTPLFEASGLVIPNAAWQGERLRRWLRRRLRNQLRRDWVQLQSWLSEGLSLAPAESELVRERLAAWLAGALFPGWQKGVADLARLISGVIQEIEEDLEAGQDLPAAVQIRAHIRAERAHRLADYWIRFLQELYYSLQWISDRVDYASKLEEWLLQRNRLSEVTRALDQMAHREDLLDGMIEFVSENLDRFKAVRQSGLQGEEERQYVRQFLQAKLRPGWQGDLDGLTRTVIDLLDGFGSLHQAGAERQDIRSLLERNVIVNWKGLVDMLADSIHEQLDELIALNESGAPELDKRVRSMVREKLERWNLHNFFYWHYDMPREGLELYVTRTPPFEIKPIIEWPDYLGLFLTYWQERDKKKRR
ncbi:MAG: hypothetical protein JXA37_07855 [Chloroflexia bacterium]|nr:hypothetical protein [Chloroflexia bacterium]